ncbi:hypothetical protein HMPREF0662_01422 [Prevotella nigrescens F0103]|nr:hypothetical protein HMPREF0662_01422 [Prevotella nigrescens F0103]
MKRDKPYPCCVENTTSLCVFEDAMARWTEPYGIAAATPYQRNDFATKQPDFSKVVLTKNDVCVFTLQKSLFCVAKQALLLCKTMGFGTYCNGAYNALSNSLRKRTSFSENKRRSLTLYFRLVMRSTPMPKA